MVCAELLGRARTKAEADPSRYERLHPDGIRLISGWFNRSLTLISSNPDESFEPFIFTWFALNGWAACVTGLDDDRDYIAALMQTRALSETFDRLLADPESTFKGEVNAFACFWPIFRVQAVREAGINYPVSGTRADVVNRYLEAGVNKYEPQCWCRHRESGSDAPSDWPHTLAALYRVRSNLFHGEKAVHSEADRSIVKASFGVLFKFLREGGYL